MKLAIISGGSKGLGAALAAQLKQQEYRVIDLSRSGKTADSVKLDLAHPEDVLTAVSPLFAQLSSQSWSEILLFNNAGIISPIGRITDKAIAEIVANININFTSAILLVREFISAFQNHACPKTIANISSGAALRGIYGWSLYCGAKAGIENFVRTIAVEQANQAHPILAINISPGIIDTGMQQTIRSTDATDFPNVGTFQGFKESGALRSPETVATAIGNILRSTPENGSRHDIANYL